MGNSYSSGRPAKDAQMKALQKVHGMTDRSRKPGPDIRNPEPDTFPGPRNVSSNDTATDKGRGTMEQQ